jgi:chitodextrinase
MQQTSVRLLVVLGLACCLAVAATEAGTVRLTWDPSPGATGYRVHRGSSSGQYADVIELGNTTQAILSDLPDCATTYFAASAFNAAGTSGLSNEVGTWPRPELAGISVAGAEQGQRLTLVITGANYHGGATLQFADSQVTVHSASIDSCYQITADVTVGSSATPGATLIQVVNPGGATGGSTALFTIQAAAPPEVVGTNPANGATAVALDVQPTVSFSEAVQAGSVSALTVRLLDSNGNAVAQAAGSPQLNGNGTVATITPAGDLSEYETYRIQVVGGSSGVRDLADHPMAATYTQAPGFVAGGEPDTDPPTTPQGVSASAVSSTEVELSWSASTDTGGSGLAGYRVYRDGSEIATTSATTYSDTGLQPSTSYSYSVSAYDHASPANESALSAAVQVATLEGPLVLFRVNAGGGAYTDVNGESWSADFGYNTGSTFESTNSISGTQDDPLYQTDRWDPTDSPELAYGFGVANGSYVVRLHFAEVYSGTSGVGLRVFDVEMEGQPVLDNLDIFAEAGANAALIKSLPVTVSDGQLDIRFVHVTQNPKVSAIEVTREVTAPDTEPPSVPQNLTGTPVGPTSVQLSWNGSTDTGGAGLAGYRVFRDGTQIATTTQTQYTDSGLQPTTQYTYTVSAYDNASPANESATSTAINVTTPANPDPLPDVQNLRRTDKIGS